MAKFNLGSINYTKLKEAAANRHSSFFRAKDGTVYVNFIQWLNDELDKFGNNTSMQLNEPMDSKVKPTYIGNTKPPKVKETSNESKESSNGSHEDSEIPF